MAAPAFRAAGAKATGTTSCIPALPTGWQANDIFLCFIETGNQVATMSAGWLAVTGSPQGVGTAPGDPATRLTVFWRRAVLGDAAPTVSVATGNHIIAFIIAYSGSITSGNPWDITAGDTLGSSAQAVSIPGATTTVPECLVVVAVSNMTDSNTAQTSGWTNANLTGLVEHTNTDQNTTTGNGGGVGVADGIKAAAGAYGTTTATLVTASYQGRLSIALKPPQDRRGQLSWGEVQVATGPRRGCISWGEIEVPALPRRACISWGEFENPIAPRRTLFSWAEMETAIAPRRAVMSWGELAAPDAPRRAEICWQELELPAGGRRGILSWAELEGPTPPRRPLLSWAELQVMDAPRRGGVGWAEAEIPAGSRKAIFSWGEIQMPTGPRRGNVNWAEAEVPTAPRKGHVSWAATEVPTASFGPRSGQLSWAELETTPTAELEPPPTVDHSSGRDTAWLIRRRRRIMALLRLERGRKVLQRVRRRFYGCS